MEKRIVFLTGASGVGKTTLLTNLKTKYSGKPEYEFLKFDSVGVPSDEDMVKGWGSGENWQRQTTYEWIDKMVNQFPDKELVVLDGQANMKFIKEGFEKQKFTDYKIILIDCDQDEMVRRLVDERQQAWLASEDMKNWLKYLRNQAAEFNVEIIDTTHINPEQVVEEFIQQAGLK